jgi:hypothetical protein
VLCRDGLSWTIGFAYRKVHFCCISGPRESLRLFLVPSMTGKLIDKAGCSWKLPLCLCWPDVQHPFVDNDKVSEFGKGTYTKEAPVRLRRAAPERRPPRRAEHLPAPSPLLAAARGVAGQSPVGAAAAAAGLQGRGSPGISAAAPDLQFPAVQRHGRVVVGGEGKGASGLGHG